MTGRGNNTYLLADGGEAALIDAGVGHERHLAELAAELGRRNAILRDVLVTHAHPDHATGAPVLAAAYPDARFVKYRWPDEDARYGVEWQHADAGEQLTIGASTTLEVLHTGGHSPDHVVFWHEASGSAFTGDLVVQGSSVMIHWSRGGDLAEYLAALERLIRLGPRVLYPAHGPVITNPEAVLTAYVAHRRMREHQVIDALRAGYATVEAIGDSIYDRLDPALMPAARENVRAHLEKLRREHVAECRDGRWAIRRRG